MDLSLDTTHLLALLVAASFAAGLNVYATVATLGLLSHAGVFPLPASLHLLENWWVIGISAALFLLEFFADKVPAFDLLWNAAQTFVRVPVAALIAWGATAQLSPADQALAAVLGAAIAFAAHSCKIAARAAVAPAPPGRAHTVVAAAPARRRPARGRERLPVVPDAPGDDA